MRLWHQDLIPHLPRQQLLGQHRECCALRGKGWGRKHATVDYVFTHLPEYLIAYHYKVMDEMKNRGYHPDETWYNPNYRGSTLGFQENWTDENLMKSVLEYTKTHLCYPKEHNDCYLIECLNNLNEKGIIL